MSAHSDNSIVIEAPFDLVWEVANDVEQWPELFAGEYTEAEVLDRDDGYVRFRLTTAPAPDGRQYRWVSERHLDRERGTVSARRLETGPFRYMHIFQSFTAVEGGVELRWVQDFEARPDAPFGDAEMLERINGGSAVNLRQHKAVIEARAAAAGRAEAGTAAREPA
jgi:aromatase